MPPKRTGSDMQSGRASKNAKMDHPALSMAAVTLADKTLQGELASLKAEFEMQVNQTKAGKQEIEALHKKSKADEQELEALKKKIVSLKKTRTSLESEVDEIDAALAKTQESNKLLKELVDAHRANRQKTKIKHKEEMTEIHSAVLDVRRALQVAIKKRRATTTANTEIGYNKGYAAAGGNVTNRERQNARDVADNASGREEEAWERLIDYVEELRYMTAD